MLLLRPSPRFRVSTTARRALPTAQVPDAVRSGAADIGLCFSRAPHKDIEVAYRQTAPVLALVPPGHPLATAASVPLARMGQYPLALPPPETTIRQMVDIVCSRQGLQLQVAQVHALVADGHGHDGASGHQVARRDLAGHGNPPAIRHEVEHGLGMVAHQHRRELQPPIISKSEAFCRSGKAIC